MKTKKVSQFCASWCGCALSMAYIHACMTIMTRWLDMYQCCMILSSHLIKKLPIQVLCAAFSQLPPIVDCWTWHTRAHTRVRMHTHTLWCSSSSLIILPHSMHCKRGLPMWCHHHLICPIQQDVLLLVKAVVYIHSIIWYSRSKSANKWLERQTTIIIVSYTINTLHTLLSDNKRHERETTICIIIVSFYCVPIHFWLAAHRKDTDTCSTYIQCGLYTCVCICELFTYVYMYNCALHLTHIILQ